MTYPVADLSTIDPLDDANLEVALRPSRLAALVGESQNGRN